MAPGRKRPPDKSSTKVYKCHPTQSVTTVICIICGDAYHQSHFNKLNNTKDLGDNLVICPEHVHMANTTYNEEDEHLSKTAKLIIAHIKTRQTDEIRKEILEELTDKSLELQSAENNISENEVMAAEHTLLKQLNKELQDKNKLLHELLEKYKEKEADNQFTRKAYAEVTKEIKIQPKKIPKIVVKIGKYEQGEVLNTITKYLVKDKNIQTKNVYNQNKSDIIINCMNVESVTAAEKLLKEKLPKCDVATEKLNKPKIKIVGIDNYTKMDIKEIENDINTRNFSDSNNSGSILHMYINEKTKLTSVIMEVPPETYKFIRDNNKRLFVGHQRCMVYDLINVSPCFNCGRLGHNGKRCKNNQICIKCTGNHETNKCISTKIECTNCTFSNKTYRTNLYTNHSPYDMSKCEILKNRIKKYIDATDYPIKPELQIWKPTRLPTISRPTRKLPVHHSTESVSSIGTSPDETPTTPNATDGAES